MIKTDIIPIFRSHGSILKSILTIEDEEDIKPNSPVSIIAIAKKYNLSKVFLCDNSMNFFIQGYENFQSAGLHLVWGLNLKICNDATEKTDDSLNTESKVIVWLKNSKGYKSLIKIYSKAFSEHSYYFGRTDWKTLLELWDDNLALSIPFYSSFLHNNNLKGYKSVPYFGGIKPNILITSCNLPFDSFLRSYGLDYAKINDLNVLEYHPVYYYRRSDWDAYCVARAIQKRSTFSKPNIDHFGSDYFSFEEYCNKSGINFI